jgi:hypothetical protein
MRHERVSRVSSATGDNLHSAPHDHIGLLQAIVTTSNDTYILACQHNVLFMLLFEEMPEIYR